MILGNKLYKMRKAKNLSHEQLALELEISKTAIINWENNKTKPSLNNLMKICDFFEVDVYSLLDDVNNVNFSNSHFKGSNYVVNSNNSTINYNNSPELIKELLDNQAKINTLINQQNVLFEQFLNKK
jgi:transcriptional regulator with XRE-family HTH domain